jgi:branched-chain amino acid transport system substrate-binding protein
VPANRLTGKGKEFYNRYKERYGIEPEGYAAYGYEAANAALEGIRRANSKDRAGILTAVAGLRDFEGVLGTWSFDENGDTSLRTMSGNTVDAGAFKFDKILGQ